MIVTLLVVSFAVFMLIALVPGDPAVRIAGSEANPEVLAQIRQQLNLDDRLLSQYVQWLGDAVRLDFGVSRYTGTTVSSDIISRLPVTASVVAAAAVVALLVGVPLGTGAGIRPGRLLDGVARTVSSLGLAIPAFVLAIILSILFAVQRSWFPILGFVKITDSPTEWVKSVTLPAVTLGLVLGAVMIRQLRASLIDTMGSNYVRAAWARGASPRLVVGKHAMKNAAMPAITVFGVQLGYLLGGSVIVEQIFSIPGLGPYMLAAILGGDVPIIQAVTLVFVVVQMMMSLLVDLTYGLLNPKIRLAGKD